MLRMQFHVKLQKPAETTYLEATQDEKRIA